MKITDKSAELIRPDVARNVRDVAAGGAGKAPAQPVAAVERADKVEISDAGREKASHVDAAAGGEAAELDPERVAAIRKRILEGAYDSVEVVGEVARRLLERGDL
jgi:negative regulator of flagellin synthesis FlgM